MSKSVFTYIFGANKEILRDPKFIDKDVDYICVTDQKNLKSKVWNLIYDPLSNVKSLRDKTALTKFNPFKYTTAKKIVIQDSSLNCISSIAPLFNMLDKYDICLKKHPQRDNLEQELPEWKVRGITVLQINKFNNMAQHDTIKLCDIPLYECCVMCIKNNTQTTDMFKNLLSLMKLLGENGNMIVSQQCTFAYLLKTSYSNLNIGIVDQHKYFIRYIHNSNKVNEL